MPHSTIFLSGGAARGPGRRRSVSPGAAHNPPSAQPSDAVRCGTTGYLLGHSLGKIRDTYVHLGSQGIMATASQETADWIAAAMAGKSVKPGVKVAKMEKYQAGTA